MHIANFVLLPLVTVMAAPGAPDFGQIDQGVAKSRAAIEQINTKHDNIAAVVEARADDHVKHGSGTRPAAQPVQPAQPAAASASAAPAPGGQGISSAYGDLTTLLSGLGSTLEGLCNLSNDISGLTTSLGL